MIVHYDQTKYLLGRRLFVFLDEWLGYAALLYLYFKKEYFILSLAIPFALFCNILSYLSLWKLRRSCGIQDSIIFKSRRRLVYSNIITV